MVLAWAAMACTDSDRSKPTSPCLLEPSEVAAVIHAKVDAGVASPGMAPLPGVQLCTYTTSASFEAITIIVQRPGQIAYEEAKTSSQSGTGIDPPYPAIAGLGDNAFSQRDAVFVLQGDVYLIIQAQNPNADFVAVAQQLAHQALLHL